MRGFDLTPLYRSTVGFDRLFSLLDGAFDGTIELLPQPLEPLLALYNPGMGIAATPRVSRLHTRSALDSRFRGNDGGGGGWRWRGGATAERTRRRRRGG